MTYTFTNNYNEELAQYIDGLFTQDKAEKLARQTRLEASDSLIESYLLRDELADTHPDKMTREEYPLLSDSQRDEREKDEVSFVWSRDVGVDGRDYKMPTRENLRKLR